MIDEEILEQKAKDYIDYVLMHKRNCIETVEQAFKDGYKECGKDTDVLIKELKSHCKAVDDVNAKMKCFLNCKNYVKCTVNLSRPTPEHCRKCDKWELAE